MSCLYHHGKDPVGGCKSCGKALCSECAVDLGKGLACRGHCEDDVRALITLIDRNIKLSPQTTRLLESGRKTKSSASIFNLILGAIFIAWGLTDIERLRFIAILGGGFFFFGLFALFPAPKIPKKRQQR